MGDLCLEIGGQVDDMYSAERTFLRADTTSDTQSFRDVSDLGLWRDFNAEFPGTDHGA